MNFNKKYYEHSCIRIHYLVIYVPNLLLICFLENCTFRNVYNGAIKTVHCVVD